MEYRTNNKFDCSFANGQYNLFSTWCSGNLYRQYNCYGNCKYKSDCNGHQLSDIYLRGKFCNFNRNRRYNLYMESGTINGSKCSCYANCQRKLHSCWSKWKLFQRKNCFCFSKTITGCECSSKSNFNLHR